MLRRLSADTTKVRAGESCCHGLVSRSSRESWPHKRDEGAHASIRRLSAGSLTDTHASTDPRRGGEEQLLMAPTRLRLTLRRVNELVGQVVCSRSVHCEEGGRRAVDQLGPNALGESLEPGRTNNCYLGLLLPPPGAGS